MVLEDMSELRSEDEPLQALIEAQRAICFMRLADLVGAEDCLDRASQLDPESLTVRSLSVCLRVQRAHIGVRDDDRFPLEQLVADGGRDPRTPHRRHRCPASRRRRPVVLKSLRTLPPPVPRPPAATIRREASVSHDREPMLQLRRSDAPPPPPPPLGKIPAPKPVARSASTARAWNGAASTTSNCGAGAVTQETPTLGFVLSVCDEASWGGSARRVRGRSDTPARERERVRSPRSGR